MKKLNIDLDELIQVLTTHSDLTGGGWYLDAETGQLYLEADGAGELPADLADDPRYVLVEPFESGDAYRVMEDFVGTLADLAAVDRLKRALAGRQRRGLAAGGRARATAAPDSVPLIRRRSATRRKAPRD